jgi:hypothetical protein
MVVAGGEVMRRSRSGSRRTIKRFAGFQSDHSVDDMGARFLQAARPLDVGRFVEARPQFDQCSHLFAVLAASISAPTIRNPPSGKRDLDGKDDGSGRRFPPVQPLDRAFIGMVQQDVCLRIASKISACGGNAVPRRLGGRWLGEGVVRDQGADASSGGSIEL